LLNSPIIDRRVRVKKICATPEEELKLIKNANAVRKSRERYRMAKLEAEAKFEAQFASMKAATAAAEKELAVAGAELSFLETAVQKLDIGYKVLHGLLDDQDAQE
jgi:hypothetical protein